MPADNPRHHHEHHPERPLPLDPDIETDEGPEGEPLPVHLTWHFIALVAVGGFFGTAARHLLGDAIGTANGFPLGIFLINIAGAFALGLLLEGLALDGVDAGHRRRFRLLLGTGFLGGFTTYSALAFDLDSLLRGEQFLTAGAYAVGTLVIGLIASIGGIAVARKVVKS